jgi:diguanylate cyclase (GGDEF)-like protein
VSVRHDRLLDGLRDVVSASTSEDCVRRIQEHAELLFGSCAVVSLGDTALSGAPGAVPLRTRGRLLGSITWTDTSELELADSGELDAFLQHAAVALDNARLLEDQSRRACCDPLTGLLNRGEFHNSLVQALARARRDTGAVLSLAVFDLDRFKAVNDRGGHAAGDRLLRAAAAALTAVCRSSDAAFRIGGDEFALILDGAGADQAAAVAERAAHAIGGLEGSAGASWGVASLPGDAVTGEGLMAAADAGMYERKGQPSTVALQEWGGATRRLEVASRLATRLTELRDPQAIATAVVRELNSAFGYYLAVVHRLHDDGVLRVLAGAGPLADNHADFLAWEQHVSTGVNGRVARSGEIALVHDTRLDPDYLRVNPSSDPGSELSVPILVDGRVWGVLNLEQLATHGFDDNDVLLAEAVVAQTGAALHRCTLIEEMEQSFAATLGVLCDALESKDPYTAYHAERVASFSLAVGRRVGLPESRSRALRYCALLHDIGKIGIRSDLLSKPSRLTAEEYAEVQQHSTIGAALLHRIPSLRDVAPLVRAVHERWDGRGYPDGIPGEAIPIEARIVAVCDAWHAMTSDRPYRRARTGAAAQAELAACAGTQFDPQVVAAFLKTLSESPGS